MMKLIFSNEEEKCRRIDPVTKLNAKDFLNENNLLKEEMSLEIDDDFIELTADSGTYDAYIEDNGTVDFSVTYEDEDDQRRRRIMMKITGKTF